MNKSSTMLLSVDRESLALPKSGTLSTTWLTQEVRMINIFRIGPHRPQFIFGKNLLQANHSIHRQHWKKHRKTTEPSKRSGNLFFIQAWEDTKLHHDNELRRSIMFEYIARQRYIFNNEVSILTTGSWRPEEEKDISRLTEESEDFMFPNTSETKPLNKPWLNAKSSNTNGGTSPTRTIYRTWLKPPEELPLPSWQLSNFWWTTVFSIQKLTIDTSWTKETTCGPLKKNWRLLVTERDSPSIWPTPKEREDSKTTSTPSTLKLPVSLPSKDNSLTSKSITPKSESDLYFINFILFFIKSLSISFHSFIKILISNLIDFIKAAWLRTIKCLAFAIEKYNLAPFLVLTSFEKTFGNEI